MVYLLHFTTPFKHAKHYLGATHYFERRMAHHEAGTGAKLLRAARMAGVNWIVARKWKAGFETEHKLKRLKKNSVLCPICNRRLWRCATRDAKQLMRLTQVAAGERITIVGGSRAVLCGPISHQSTTQTDATLTGLSNA